MATSPRRALLPSYQAESEAKLRPPARCAESRNSTFKELGGEDVPCRSADFFPARASTKGVEGSSDRAATPHDILIALTYGLGLVRTAQSWLRWKAASPGKSGSTRDTAEARRHINGAGRNRR